jgi:hypothetical protein
VTHLERNQVTDLRIDFSARIDLAETTVRIPLDPLTYTETIETDIFGTKPDERPQDGSGDGSTDGSTDSSAPDDGDDTAGTSTADETDAASDGGTTAPTATATEGEPDGTTTRTTTDGGLIDV